MPYIETQDLLDELGEDVLIKLTDNDGTGEVDETRVLKATEFASGVFDSYARSRYSIPVRVTPLVKSLNLDIATWHLQKSRTSQTGGIYDARKQAFDDAVKLLKDISQGKAALDVPAAEETVDTPATSDRILTNAGRHKFTDDTLNGF